MTRKGDRWSRREAREQRRPPTAGTAASKRLPTPDMPSTDAPPAGRAGKKLEDRGDWARGDRPRRSVRRLPRYIGHSGCRWPSPSLYRCGSAGVGATRRPPSRPCVADESARAAVPPAPQLPAGPWALRLRRGSCRRATRTAAPRWARGATPCGPDRGRSRRRPGR